jgi:hypothetical protein
VPPVTIHPAAVLLGAAVGRLHSPAAEISGPPSWTDSRSRSPRAESHPNHARRSSSADVEGASARSRSRARRPCSRPREDLLPAQARAARRRAVDARRLLGEHGRVRAQRRIRCSSGAGGGCGGRARATRDCHGPWLENPRSSPFCAHSTSALPSSRGTPFGRPIATSMLSPMLRRLNILALR